jgi:hypothetical protein
VKSGLTGVLASSSEWIHHENDKYS